jgi:7-cyano-7-deazaguanine synthase
MSTDWKERLGPDHVADVDLIGQIAGKAIISPPDHTLIAGEGFEAGSRYIPGRNLIFLSMSASVAFRRGIATLVCGASETEYSGYPDCRDASMRAIESAISLASGFKYVVECPLMWLDKAGVWTLAHSLGGNDLIEIIQEQTHTCYQGSRDERHEWGYGCGSCDACRLRAKGWKDYRARQTP